MSAKFPRTILVPHDFTDTAERALAVAKALLRAEGGGGHLILAHAHFVPLEIEVLAVRGAEQVFAELEAEAVRRLSELVSKLEEEGISAEYVAARASPETLIVQLALDKGVDLIAMGTHARRGLGHVLLGSIAERVLRTAPCPVLTVPPP